MWSRLSLLGGPSLADAQLFLASAASNTAICLPLLYAQGLADCVVCNCWAARSTNLSSLSSIDGAKAYSTDVINTASIQCAGLNETFLRWPV